MAQTVLAADGSCVLARLRASGSAEIEQLERFARVLSTAGAEARGPTATGARRGTQPFKAAEEDDRVILFFGWKIFGWKGEEAFEAFGNDPPVRDTMKSGGTERLPEFTVPKKIAELPG